MAAAEPPLAGLTSQLFIAPSGEPFRAAQGEPYPVAAWFARADSNHDGQLTSGEFIVDTSRFFETLDLDHDRSLSSEEIKRYETVVAPEVQTGDFSSSDDSGSGDIGGAQPRRRGARALGFQGILENVPEVGPARQRSFGISGGSRYGIIAIPEPVKAMDTDLNGTVSRTEMLSAAQRRFRILDTEERNYLRLADLPETYAQDHADRIRKRR